MTPQPDHVKTDDSRKATFWLSIDECDFLLSLLENYRSDEGWLCPSNRESLAAKLREGCPGRLLKEGTTPDHVKILREALEYIKASVSAADLFDAQVPVGLRKVSEALPSLDALEAQLAEAKALLQVMEARALKAEVERDEFQVAFTKATRDMLNLLWDDDPEKIYTAGPDGPRLVAKHFKDQRDSLKARLEAAERVIAASRCIRHWHDTAQGGMIVSQEKVFELWAALEQYDAAMTEKEPKA